MSTKERTKERIKVLERVVHDLDAEFQAYREHTETENGSTDMAFVEQGSTIGDLGFRIVKLDENLTGNTSLINKLLSRVAALEGHGMPALQPLGDLIEMRDDALLAHKESIEKGKATRKGSIEKGKAAMAKAKKRRKSVG